MVTDSKVPSVESHTSIETDWEGVRESDRGGGSVMLAGDETREEPPLSSSEGVQDSLGVVWEVTEGSSRSPEDSDSGVS
jgi:hypothetical protein